MSHDRIVVYSNGIADHQRGFTVRKGESRRIALPVRRDHLADVLASLNVFGDVTLTEPPSFEPADVDAGSFTLNEHNALACLATELSGSRVEVDRGGGTEHGRLLGLHTEQHATSGDRVERWSLMLLTEGGTRRVPFEDVVALRFTEDAVRDEVDKALRRKFQKIKPFSTTLDLALETDADETEAVLQFTLPAAAWKITYRLCELDTDGYELQGFAVVTNDTDEDWKDVTIAVVTGEPITFSTDLAETKIPRRKHVDVVSEESVGAVSVDSMLQEHESKRVMMDKGDLRRPRSAAIMGLARAHAPETKVEEVGDFCFFESQTPVSIAARRSAAIPVFRHEVGEAKTVLHFKYQNHAERPFRAVDFTNDVGHGLGRGVCTVYQSGTYAGSCVLPAMKTGEQRLLPHALETGVRVQRIQKPREETVVAIHVSEGACRRKLHRRTETRFDVRSHRDEEYRFVLDHDWTQGRSTVEASLTRARETTSTEPVMRADGPRIEVTIGPRDVFTLTIVESRVRSSSAQLLQGNGDAATPLPGWLRDNLIDTNGPLADHPAVLECLAIQERIDEKSRTVADAVTRIERLTNRQERLRKNIAAAGSGEQAGRWRNDLAEAETAIAELEETTIPALHAERDAITAELRAALRTLWAEWSE